MKRTLYTLITGEVHQCILASSFTQAVTWAEQHLPALGGAELLTITANPGVVDLAEGEPVAQVKAPLATPPPVRVKAATPTKAGKAKASVPEGMVLLSALATERGCTVQNIKFMLKKRGVEVSRISGMHGMPAAAPEREARTAMEAKPERKSKGKAKPVAAKASAPAPVATPVAAAPPPAPYDPDAPWDPLVRPTDKYVEVAKACRAVGLNDSQLHEVKRHGRIAGGNGWVNLTQLEAYMQHPDYEPPFASN